MAIRELMEQLKSKYKIVPKTTEEKNGDEIHLGVGAENLNGICVALHKELNSPVMMMFAEDLGDKFIIYCVFLGLKYKKWIFATTDIQKDKPEFPSIAKEIYSANRFEREIKEMFGLAPAGNPDQRRLRLHDEVWPEGYYPLRKDFAGPKGKLKLGEYAFVKVEGEGVFEVPVGPVHAGIIGPGHFRFSVAGEPIINLDIRLGFTHRGIEKMLEGKSPDEALKTAECVAGDSSIAHSSAFCHAVEKIWGIQTPGRALAIRAIMLELERMYNHAAAIGGIALDVGFSQPAALSSIIKESIHRLGEELTGSRYFKGVNIIGGTSVNMTPKAVRLIQSSLAKVMKEHNEVKKILFSSVSFLDRVDTTGMLMKKTAEDFGVLGVAGRASGVALDLRKDMPGIQENIVFRRAKEESGDVLARLNVRIHEFEESFKIINELLVNISLGDICNKDFKLKKGHALGYIEGGRGPVLYWVRLGSDGAIKRCKIVDPSFRNWLGLSYAVHSNIIPDFPVCNKSFDLSYPGGDL